MARIPSIAFGLAYVGLAYKRRQARLRTALWMLALGAVRRNPWLRAFHEGLRARGKLPKVVLVAAMRKLLHAAYSVAQNRKPFTLKAVAG